MLKGLILFFKEGADYFDKNDQLKYEISELEDELRDLNVYINFEKHKINNLNLEENKLIISKQSLEDMENKYQVLNEKYKKLKQDLKNRY